MSMLSKFFARHGMNALNGLDDRRLSDLGLNRYDLHDARRSRDAAALLASRRNERAAAWLR